MPRPDCCVHVRGCLPLEERTRLVALDLAGRGARQWRVVEVNDARLHVIRQRRDLRAQRRERAFAVTAMATYGLHDAPLSRIFGPSSERRLNLITCGGAWDEQRHTYDARLVVYTRLAG